MFILLSNISKPKPLLRTLVEYTTCTLPKSLKVLLLEYKTPVYECLVGWSIQGPIVSSPVKGQRIPPLHLRAGVKKTIQVSHHGWLFHVMK